MKKKYLLIVDNNDGMAHVQNVMILEAENLDTVYKKAKELQGCCVRNWSDVQLIEDIEGDFAYFT